MTFFFQEAENYGKNVAIFASFALSDIPGKDLSQEFSSESQNCAPARLRASPQLHNPAAGMGRVAGPEPLKCS